MAAIASVSCQPSQSPRVTPAGGGVMPRAKYRSTTGAPNSSTIPRGIENHRRLGGRFHSATASSVTAKASVASAPADRLSGPSAGRKKAIGEKNRSNPSASPTGARASAATPSASTPYRARALRAVSAIRTRVRTRSQPTARVPRASVAAVASPNAGGTGSTLNSRRGPAVVGSV